MRTVESLPKAVSITTGSRLHFGPLSYNPATGRHFGGIGLMVDAPGVRLCAEATVDQHSRVTGSPRAAEFLQSLMSNSAQSVLTRSLKITVEREIPSHQGLGSGTQLGLAVAEAVLTMNGVEVPATAELAQLVGRGKRSAIGIHGYEQGGFLVEAGQKTNEEIGALAVQLRFPDAWSMELISLDATEGMHGPQELQAFGELPPMPAALSGRLCQIALTEILPAIQSAHLTDFCAALDTYGDQIGRFFAPIQGGIYATPTIRELVPFLRNHNVTGIAQSSWGPTIAICCLAQQRDNLHAILQTFPKFHELTMQTAQPLNAARQLVETTLPIH